MSVDGRPHRLDNADLKIHEEIGYGGNTGNQIFLMYGSLIAASPTKALFLRHTGLVVLSEVSTD